MGGARAVPDAESFWRQIRSKRDAAWDVGRVLLEFRLGGRVDRNVCDGNLVSADFRDL